jgi:hypothetical protein
MRPVLVAGVDWTSGNTQYALAREAFANAWTHIEPQVDGLTWAAVMTGGVS